MTAQSGPGTRDAFTCSRECFETVVAWLDSDETTALDHATLEGRLNATGRELLRQLFQDHIELRAALNFASKRSPVRPNRSSNHRAELRTEARSASTDATPNPISAVGAREDGSAVGLVGNGRGAPSGVGHGTAFRSNVGGGSDRPARRSVGP